MKRQGKITIDGSQVIVEPGPDGQIWLSRWELVDLFGVYTATITSNIKAIIRSGTVKPSFDGTVVQQDKTFIPELYDMEMIIALAFRIDSHAADTFRKWVIDKATTSQVWTKLHIIVGYCRAECIN